MLIKSLGFTRYCDTKPYKTDTELNLFNGVFIFNKASLYQLKVSTPEGRIGLNCCFLMRPIKCRRETLQLVKKKLKRYAFARHDNLT